MSSVNKEKTIYYFEEDPGYEDLQKNNKGILYCYEYY